jgi:serine/threonine protein kinase
MYRSGSIETDNQHPTPQLLEEFFTGAIAEDSIMSEIEEHLLDCQSCAEFVSRLNPHDLEVRIANAMGSSELAAIKPNGRYQVLEEIGRGGLGIVYKAWQTDLDRILAWKVLISGNRASASELARFRREAHALAQIDHPQIVKVHDFGEQDGSMYLAMEFVDGPTLAQRLARGPIETRMAAVWVRDLARAIAFAHKRSIFHRDLKPHNILLARNGSVEDDQHLIPKIVDFGLAKFERDELFQTRTGETLGTPAYLAPEMVGIQHDQPVTPAIDVYGLGTILYECLTGRPPFIGSSHFEILSAVVDTEPAEVQSLRANVPRDLAIICHRCLAKTPSSRFGSATELADDIDRFLNGQPIRSRSVSQSEKVFRWCQRNPWKALVAGLLSLGLMAVPAAGVYHNSQLRKEKRIAQQRYESTRATVWAMLNQLNENSAQSIPQIAEVSAAQFDESLKLFDELAAADPSGRSQLDAARVRIHAGSLAVILGNWDEAGALLDEAINVCERWLDSPEHGVEAAEQLAAALNKLSISHSKSNDSAKRIAVLEKALSIHRELARRKQNEPASRGKIAWSLINLGSVHQISGDFPKAVDSYEEALQICDDLIKANYETVETQKTAAGCRINLATIQLQQGDTKSSEANFRSAIEDLEKHLKAASSDKTLIEDLSTGLLNYSNCLQANGQSTEAIAACERAQKMLLNALELEPNRALLKQNLFLVTANRAHLFSVGERYVEAAPAWQVAIEVAQDPSIALYCHQMRNICLVKTGDFSTAVHELKSIEEQTVSPNEKFLQALGWALVAKGDSDQARVGFSPPSEEIRQESVARAWKLLSDLKSAGHLSAPEYQDHLLTDDWTELRKRLSPEVWGQVIEKPSKKGRP